MLTPQLIEVTGQPRFDLYAAGPARLPSARRRVLFLTYALDAYVPGAGRGKGLRTWEPLRSETESALLELARAGTCEVVVKCHPQQDRRAEADRLARLAGVTWNQGVSVAAADADTRDLIIESDVVVGFQTTAMYEAVAAGAASSTQPGAPNMSSHREGLIPFDAAPRWLSAPCGIERDPDRNGRRQLDTAGLGLCGVVRGARSASSTGTPPTASRVASPPWRVPGSRQTCVTTSTGSGAGSPSACSRDHSPPRRYGLRRVRLRGLLVSSNELLDAAAMPPRRAAWPRPR